MYLFKPRDQRLGSYFFCPVCHLVIIFKTLTFLLTFEQSKAHNIMKNAHNDKSTHHNDNSTSHNDKITPHNDKSTPHKVKSTLHMMRKAPHISTKAHQIKTKAPHIMAKAHGGIFIVPYLLLYRTSVYIYGPIQRSTSCSRLL